MTDRTEEPGAVAADEPLLGPPRVDPDVRPAGPGRRRGDGLVHDVWLGLRQGRLREYAPPGAVFRDSDGRLAPLAGYEPAWAEGCALFLDQAHRLYAAAPACVPRIWRVGDPGGGAWIITAPGTEPLSRALGTGIALAPGDVIRIARDLADALAEVHALGVTHLDICPETVSIVGGQLTLGDFTVDNRAFLRTLGTDQGLVRPGYSPVELYEGAEPLGPATDIYAASALIYRLMTGREPLSWQERWREPGPLPIPVDAGHYPPAFVAAIRRGLEIEPRGRFADAASWRQAMGDPEPPVLELGNDQTFQGFEPETIDLPWPDVAPHEPPPGANRGGGWLLVALIGLIGIAILTVTFLLLRPPAEAEGEAATQAALYVVTSPANVRSGPGPGSEIVGRLVAGDRVTGAMTTAESGERWLRITEGEHAGAYVWARNLALPSAGSSTPAPPVLQPAAPAPIDLSARFSYDDDANCRFHPQIDAAMTDMVSYQSTGRGVPRTVTIDTMRLTPAVTSIANGPDNSFRTDAVLRFDKDVRWNGLTIRGLFTGQGYEDSARGVLYAQDPSTVRAKLAEMGVSIPLPPDHLELPTDVCFAGIWLERRDGGTALVCGSGC